MARSARKPLNPKRHGPFTSNVNTVQDLSVDRDRLVCPKWFAQKVGPEHRLTGSLVGGAEKLSIAADASFGEVV